MVKTKSISALLLFLLPFFSATGAEPVYFINSLGMKFVPIPGTNLLISIWETRVSDFQQFASEGDRIWPEPYFDQGPDHPAVNISWEDANQFCSWLTRKESEAGLLPDGWIYRLPGEDEWMLAAMQAPSLEDDDFTLPGAPELVFAWGSDWPPPRNAGNFAKELHVDDYENTSPVGSFPPNEYGIFDLSGNVWEWCRDFYEGARDLRVLKGGSFSMREVSDLLLSARIGNVSYLRLPAYGFRVVIETR